MDMKHCDFVGQMLYTGSDVSRYLYIMMATAQDATCSFCINDRNKKILEMVLGMEEFKLKTPTNKIVEEHIESLIQATGPQALSFERIMLVIKQKVLYHIYRAFQKKLDHVLLAYIFGNL